MMSISGTSYRWVNWFGAALLLVVGLASTASAERPPAAALLPDTTVALVSVPDAPVLAERFMKTSMGRMSQDPQLKPLLGNLYASLVKEAAILEERLGLSLPELLAIPQGEISVAVVAPEDRPLAIVLLLDTDRQVGKARQLVDRITTQMDNSGIRNYEETIAGTKLLIFEGPIPGRRTVFLEKEATFVVGTDVEVVKQLLAVWNGGKGGTISNSPDYTDIMRRCGGSASEKPQLTWWANPIGIMRGIGQENTGVRVAVATLPALGLDGLTAVGGSVTFDAGQFDSVMHAHVLLHPNRSGVIKMVALRSGDSKPQRWVPADVASYTTLHWNVGQTFKELATLYDSFNGEGALAQFLQRRFLEPTGLDLEKELLPELEGRVTLLSWFERPVTPQSQAILLAVKLKDTKVFEKAVEKVFSLAEGNIAKETWAGMTYYQVRPQVPDDLPPNQLPPQPCFGILDDYLLVTTRVGLYKKVVTTLREGAKSLADDPEFKLIVGKIRRQSGGKSPAMVSFNRPEETVRWLYDMATSQQTQEQLGQQAENSRFFRTLNTAMQENPLPPFAVLRQYLAPGGAMVVDDQTGLHYMSFTLQRKSD